MTPECIETIRRMAEQGKSGKEIANAVNYSLKYVYNVCEKNGIKIPRRTARWKVTDKETGKVYIGTMAELEKQVYVSRSTLYNCRKNGVKIFEGDKVADERGKIAVVKFGDFNCGCCYDVFGYFLDGDFEEFRYCSGKGPDECYLTVVGNIHDEVTP